MHTIRISYISGALRPLGIPPPARGKYINTHFENHFIGSFALYFD